MTLPIEILGEGLSDRYRLEGQVGAGGMATVYLAHDLRHDRKVAIKVLHPELAAVIGAERFLAEIRTTANLQHPHILPLFDSGAIAAAGTRDARLLFYVMPFIEGESLRQRLTRERQLPVADAVRIASEVASALDYAHRKGIVHRDIKPENVLLHDGSALVADFGIALAVTAAGGGRLTQTGLSLGTPAYMSPEQAMGEREIGPRSDVYALGAVTYEMLSGEPPFTGPTSQAIVARTLTEQPRPLRSERKSIPPAVEATVLRALEKLPADRQGTAKEFAEGLAGQGAVASGAAATEAMPVRALRKPRAWLPLVAGAALLGVLGFITGRALRGDAGAKVQGGPVSFRPTEMGTMDYFSVSQDGQYLVGIGLDSSGVRHVLMRPVSDAKVMVVPNTRGIIRAWLTPDNRALVVRTGSMLRFMPLDGGSSRDLIAVSGYVTVEWLSKDSMIVVSDRKLMVVPVDGTGARMVAQVDSSEQARFYIPRALPGGKNILVGKTYSVDSVAFYQMDLEFGTLTQVLPNVHEARAFAPDRLLWLDGDGKVRYGTYNQQTRKVGERQVIIDEGVDDLFANGDVIMLRPGLPKSDLLLRREHETRTEQLAIPDTSTSTPIFSPDGSKLAVLLTPLAVMQRVNDAASSSGTSLWVIDRRTGVRKLLLEHASDMGWFPDGKRLAVLRRRPSPQKTDILIVSAEGDVPPIELPSSGSVKFTPSVTPDGTALLYAENNGPNNPVRLKLQTLGGGTPVAPFDDPGEELGGLFSPDGRWLLYASGDDTDAATLLVRSWPSLERRSTVGPLVLCPAQWAENGTAIYTCTADGVLSRFRFDPVAGRVIGSPEPIVVVTQKNPDFGVSPVGRDLAWIPASPRYTTEPKVLANWRGDAERRLRAR